MLLPLEDANLFFKLHRSLMQFANERLNIVATGQIPCDFGDLSPEHRRKVIQAFLGRLDLIDEFVTQNPAAWSQDELQIVSSWRHLVAGKFIVLRQLKEHMIFLASEGSSVAYGVLGLTEPLEVVVGMHLPAMVEAVLLPFRERIIYDGLAGRFNILFGPGTRKSFEDSYRAAKERHGIVTSLPKGAPPETAATTNPKRRAKPVRESRLRR